jgi:hypothetical protein
MTFRLIAAVTVVALTSGCTHVRRVGRPPSAGEIEAINRSASGEPGTLSMIYFDPLRPCAGGTCRAERPRPIVDAPPFEIERIVSATMTEMTVVAVTGDRWHLDTSKIAGVTTRHRATITGGVTGAAFGFGFGCLTAIAASGPWSDSSAASNSSQSSSIGRSAEIVTISTVVGAIVGAVVGHAIFRRDSFEIGDTGSSSDPSSPLGR